MMAANVTESGTGKTTTIEDIYNSYYDNVVKQLSEESSTIMKSLAVISILNAIDLKHDNEIIDMVDDDIAKISEQCI